MTILGNDFEPLKCPKCHNSVIKLVSLTDDGKGRKICRKCKKPIKKAYPNRDYSRIKCGGDKAAA